MLGTTTSTLYNVSSGTGFSYRNGVALDIARQNTSSAEPLLNLNLTGVDGSHILFYKDGTTVGTIGNNSGGLYIGSGDAGVTMESTLDAIIPTNTSSGSYTDNALDIGYSTKRFKDAYLSGGLNIYNSSTDAVDIRGTGSRCEIDNPGNNAILLKTGGTTRVRIDANGLLFGSDTASANALDDYETGTFTPTVQTGSISAANGIYVKIGDFVYCSFTAGHNMDTTSSNQIKFGNLPFANGSVAEGSNGSVFCRYSNAIPNAVLVDTSATTTRMFQSSSGAYHILQHSDLNNSASALFYIQVTYRTN
jgi:hypothetical protein